MKTEIPWDLIISKLQHRIAVEEDRQLMKWLDDNRNKEVFDELQQVWEKVQNNASGYVPDSDHYWKELSKRMATRVDRIESRPKTKPFAFVSSVRRYAAVACIAFVVTFSISFYLGIEVGQPKAEELVYSNLVGKSKMILPDGTVVWLHSKTSLACDTYYDWKYRQINLTGEAYFDVAHDKEKPFIVQTEGMKVIVHGTKFNIESFPESGNTFVSLIEGSVALETSIEKRFLQPGEMATYNKNSNQLMVEKSNVDFESSWAKDMLTFEKQSLGVICKFLSKWYNIKISLDPRLSDKYLYTFKLQKESLEEVMRIMDRIHPMDYTFNEQNELIISAQ
ncbi:FecR domain-containing protein [Bacteroides sp.]|uniref:FecR family protein n=1 Tax=Bacteroides sp. TaxID=29523 RepID=UPI002FCC4B1F